MTSTLNRYSNFFKNMADWTLTHRPLASQKVACLPIWRYFSRPGEHLKCGAKYLGSRPSQNILEYSRVYIIQCPLVNSHRPWTYMNISHVEWFHQSSNRQLVPESGLIYWRVYSLKTYKGPFWVSQVLGVSPRRGAVVFPRRRFLGLGRGNVNGRRCQSSNVILYSQVLSNQFNRTFL